MAAGEGAKRDACPPLILASSSPRRRVLLRRFGRAFAVTVPEVDESVLPGEDPASHVRRLAGEKSADVARSTERGLVIGADTVVVLDGRILGKPEGREDAFRMLSSLSGRSHLVYSGVAVADAQSGAVRSVVVCSRVTMAVVKPEEITRYIDTGEPLDKAGAYAVQGKGSRYVLQVQRSFTNVVGLPLRALQHLLRLSGCPVSLPRGPR